MAKTKTLKKATGTKTKKAGVTKAKPAPTPKDEVTICRRRNERRQDADTEEELFEGLDEGAGERRKVPRRRQIDPTTCERDYTQEEIEFMHALDAYKRSSGRMFPTCSEILEVVRGLGYSRSLDSLDDNSMVETVVPPVVTMIEGTDVITG